MCFFFSLFASYIYPVEMLELMEVCNFNDVHVCVICKLTYFDTHQSEYSGNGKIRPSLSSATHPKTGEFCVLSTYCIYIEAISNTYYNRR